MAAAKTAWSVGVDSAGRRRIRRSISRVLFGRRTAVDGHSSGTVVTDRLARRPGRLTRKPARTRGRGPVPAVPTWSCSRWGYRAGLVTAPAVRSSTPFHPYPRRGQALARAVCFLWHFPWGRPRRAAGTVFPWSPDFPPAPRQRPSDHLIRRHYWRLTPPSRGTVTLAAGRRAGHDGGATAGGSPCL